MPNLTVKEKEFWRDRIARKIDKKIEAVSSRDPNLQARVAARAHQRALESLGLAVMQAELDAFEKQEQELETSRRRVQQAMLAAVRRVPVEEATEAWYGQLHREIVQAIDKRRVVHEQEFLAEDDNGREVLKLRQEKEDLLETIWLATSPGEVRSLWAKVIEFLGDEQTTLQRGALAIAPVHES
jgi:hypothetical protein